MKLQIRYLRRVSYLFLCTVVLLACRREEIIPVTEEPSVGNLIVKVPGTEANTFSYDLYSEVSYAARLNGNLMPTLLRGNVVNNKIEINDLTVGNYIIVIYRPSQGSHYGVQVSPGKTKEYTF